MTYKVTGAAAVVELDDGKPELGTGPRVYLEQNAVVPDNAKKAHVEHLLTVGLIEKGTVSTPTAEHDDAPAKADAKSASKSA